MRPTPLQTATAAAGLLVVATVAMGLLGAAPTPPGPDVSAGGASETPQGAPLPSSADGHNHAHDRADSAGSDETSTSARRAPPTAAQLARDHFRAGEEGHVPTRAQAAELEHQLRNFRVRGDEGLAEMVERGYVVGTGTLEDPYVLEHFRVRGDLDIRDTSKALVIRNSYVEGQLTLNYNGPHVYVHHTYIHDLRVNENVEREADTTAGLFEHNEIAFIGQLRHFSGEFRHNEVGPRPSGVVTEFLSDTGPRPLPEGLVWNFDGYHGGLVHNNTVIGRVDVKLHGHYHGDCDLCPAHDHADPAGFPPGNERSDGAEPASHHSYRTHSLAFVDNNIRVADQALALRFYDDAHAGDDQTANSEPNEYLEDLHDHHTFLKLARNKLDGGALALDIVNPDNERHEGRTSEAFVELVGNEVVRERPRGFATNAAERFAYIVHAATTLALDARDNTYRFTESDSMLPASHRWLLEPPAETAGFHLERVDLTRVLVAGTHGEGATYGVQLTRTGEDLDVELRDNHFNAKEDIHHG